MLFHRAPKVCLTPPLKPWLQDCRWLLPMRAEFAIYLKMAKFRAVSWSRFMTYRLLRPRWDAFSTTRICGAFWRSLVGKGRKLLLLAGLENSCGLCCFPGSRSAPMTPTIVQHCGSASLLRLPLGGVGFPGRNATGFPG